MKKEKYIIGFSLLQLLFIMTLIVHFFDPNLFSSSRTEYNDTLLTSGLFSDCTVISMKSEITAYCPDSCCNAGTIIKNGRKQTVDWSNKVAASDISINELHKHGIQIVAVDPKVIPHGSMVSYGGTRYLAIDSGAAITGTRLDISLETHTLTHEFGRKTDQEIIVHIPKNPDAVLDAVKKYIKARTIASGN